MAEGCNSCGTTGGDVATLKPADPDEAGGQIRLCGACMDAKTTKVWEGESGKGPEIKQALAEHSMQSPRYMHVLDEGDRVRLLRVDHEWAREKLSH